MSQSKTSPKLTPAGVVLSAEARDRLQQLADWMEVEMREGSQDPRVLLRYYGGTSTDTEKNVTYVSPLGALVQMFDPFKLADARPLRYGLYAVTTNAMLERVASVLGIERSDVTLLIAYLSPCGIDNRQVVEVLRTLK